MIWLYNLMWHLVLPGVICYLICRRFIFGKYRDNLASKVGLGRKPRRRRDERKVIWLHALSVGEVISAIPLVRSLQEQLSSYRVVVSTTTESGQQVARERLEKPQCEIFYLPLDFYWSVRRAVKAVDSCLFVLVETDLWPNLLWCLHKEKTPIVLVNGRLSDRSFTGYRRLKSFFGPFLDYIEMFCMQSPEDAQRIRTLCRETADVRVTGNMKFDRDSEETPQHERQGLIGELGWNPRQLVWIAGSTHPGEEECILQVFSRLRRRFHELCLILAPRKSERFVQVTRLAEQTGYRTVRRTQLDGGLDPGVQVDVLILDTIGELARFYSLGNFAFLGGSLVSVGGHNPLEPARRGLPVVFGPHMENFRDIAAALMEGGGGFQVTNEYELYHQIEAWLEDQATCREQGKKALEIYHAHQGAVAKNIEVIRELLNSAERKAHGA
jgi:3-deoxy-D-manno-octulosonic-acid transferase